MPRTNELGQPIGHPLGDWKAPPRPPREPMLGRFCQIETIDPSRHAADLHAANRSDELGRLWTYMSYGPFASFAAYETWMKHTCLGEDPMFHAIVDVKSGRALGVASYLRIDPGNGSIEVGHICYSPPLQRTPLATEAMFLMMQRAFALGYRRYEWKCDALNEPSRRAALRLGFTFEGVFRQATHYKGRNRDTAWYSIIDAEWPRLRSAYEAWLAPTSFDDQGRQRASLQSLMDA